MTANDVEVVALSGGVGGAKLALGLQRTLSPGALAVIVNTGDDFNHLGLAISPDIDTVLYTLAGVADLERGWGRQAESWTVMDEIARFGGPVWFRLGDKDLALHLERTRRLAAGESLTQITADFARRLGVASHVVAMSDDPVRTLVETPEGILGFQEYFVARRCQPVLRRILFEGAERARASAAAVQLIENTRLAAVIICPSNPYLSIDPMLAVPFWREALRRVRCPVIAVSPIIAGAAVKGPAAKIMSELGRAVTPVCIADHYRGLIDGLVIDEADRELASRCGMPVHVTNTWMRTLQDRDYLAGEVLAFATRLAGMPRERCAAVFSKTCEKR